MDLQNWRAKAMKIVNNSTNYGKVNILFVVKSA